MKQDLLESKENMYSVYYTSDGKKLIVLDGLDVTQQQEQPFLQQYINNNYDTFLIFYWSLLIVSISFMICKFILIPVFKRRHVYK